MAYLTDTNIRNVPKNAIGLGREWGNTTYLAVANTDKGQIPCKAVPGEAIYCYGGEQRKTWDFVWVTVPEGFQALAKKCQTVPVCALKTGFQLDRGDMYAGIAHTDGGDVPCKISASDGSCHYALNGKENLAANYSFVTFGKKPPPPPPPPPPRLSLASVYVTK